MAFKFYCRNCNQKLEASPELYGEEIICPKCSLAIRIPNPLQMMESRPEKLSDTTMACPLCGYPRIDLPAAPYGEAVCGNCLNKIPLSEPPPDRLTHQLPALPDYYLVRKLGEGGSGSVYEARQIKLDNRSVAVKLLTAEITTRDPLATEISALVRLSHPYIVRIFDAVEHEQTRGIVMELVTGPHCEPVSLRNILDANGGKLSPEAALHTALTIANALEYAHRQNVLHLDLKPENILVDHLGMIRIVDFGISRFKQPPEPGKPAGQMLTAAQEVFGTPGYVAPERSMASEPPSPRMDIYSLGAVFYEMLTGKIPGGRFQLPTEINASMPKCLDAVIEFSLNLHPEKRYAGMTAMGEALNEALKIVRAGAGFAVPAKLSSATENTMRIRRPDVKVSKNKKSFSFNERVSGESGSPYRMLGAFAIACLVLGVVIFVIVALSGKKTPTPEIKTPIAEVTDIAAADSGKVVDKPAVPSTEAVAEAMFKESVALFDGKAVPRDVVKALELLRRAAEKGSIPACTMLGELYFYEEYGLEDPGRALAYFRKAAESRDAGALYNLGECYYYGRCGVDRDYDQAVKYYQQALEKNSVEAAYALGRCYERGHGVIRNSAKAMLLFRQAAAGNYGPAKSVLASEKNSDRNDEK